MPITTAELKIYLSGGAGNSDPDASLGGVISTTEMVAATLENLFSTAPGDETTAGSTKYRCVYFKNTDGALTWQAVKAWLSGTTPSSTTHAEFAIGTAAVNATEQTIADEDTAPTGVSWSTATTKVAGLSPGNIPAGEYRSMWLKRVIDAGTTALNLDNVVLRLEGDTAE